MKKLILLIFLLPFLAAAQIDYYLTLPPEASKGIPVIVGETTTLYGNTLINIPLDSVYTWEYICDIGSTVGENFVITPTTEQIGRHRLIVDVKKDGATVARDTTTLSIHRNVNPATLSLMAFGSSSMVNTYGFEVNVMEGVFNETTITTYGVFTTFGTYSGYNHNARSGSHFQTYLTNSLSPLVKDGEYNVAAFFEDNNFPIPDFVHSRIGALDIHAYCPTELTDSELAIRMNRMKMFVDGFLDYDPDIKFIFSLPHYTGTDKALWDAQFDGTDKEGLHDHLIYSAKKFHDGMINTFMHPEYSERVYIDLSMFHFDRSNHTDWVHMNGEGGGQLGFGLAATINQILDERNVFYVATNGNNSNPGTKAEPFLTIQHGINQLNEGDTLYIRGGVYNITSAVTITGSSSSGTQGYPIVVSAYPPDHAVGNVPIIDGINAWRTSNFFIFDNQWWKFWGITSRNALQDGEAAVRSGFRAIRSQYIFFEQCVAHNIAGIGFQAEQANSIAYFINCDAYNIADTLFNPPNQSGGRGGGFSVGAAFGSDTTTWAEAHFIGCRAWNISDNAFSTAYGVKKAVFDSCWAINTGQLDGDGRGWAIGINEQGPPTHRQHQIRNSISAYSRDLGYNINSRNKPYQISLEAYNNFDIGGLTYEYEGGLYVPVAWMLREAADNTGAVVTFRNNAVYGRSKKMTDQAMPGWLYDSEVAWDTNWDWATPDYSHSYNTWNYPEMTLTEADFVGPMDSLSLVTALTAPRKADGSLPDVPNLWPSSSSQLRDAGTDVGLDYYGTAPDLGPFQYDPGVTAHILIFQIENENGNAINNASITFDGATRPPGVYTLHGIEEGTYDFSVAAPGYETYVYTGLVVEEDMEIQVVMIQLPAYTISFDVKNTQDNPIGNATITFGTITNPTGNYNFSNIPPGTYNYSVVAPGYQTVNVNNYEVDGNATIPVVMTLNNYQINLSGSPAAGGSVSGQGSYQHGQTVHVSAQANTGYNFVNWTENGNSVSTNPDYTFTATQNRNLVANFSVQTYSVGLSSNPTGAGTLTGAGNYNHNANVTINAQANTGYTFVNWTENGNVVSTNPQFSFNITSNRSLIANFSVSTHEIQASAIPAEGGSVSGAGTYSYGEIATLTATAADDYTFTYWRENGNVVSNQQEYSFTVTHDRNLTAHFAIEVYLVTLESIPTDAGILNGAGNYSPGDNVTINAQANTGYSFVNWTENGSVVSTNPQFSFIISDNREFTANFSINTYNITAVANPVAGGNVSGAGTYNHGETASLQATPAEEYNFVNWTENGNVVSQNPLYSFTVTQNRNLTANFAIGVFSVTLESNPTGAGILQGEGNYSPGDNVTIYAEPNPGFVFENWTDGELVVSQDPQFSFEITGDRNFTANFSNEILTLTLNPNPTFGGITTGAGSYPHGENVTAGAIPNPGFHFVSWTQKGLTVSGDAFYSFPITQDRDLTAEFAPNEYLIQVLVSPEESGSVTGAGEYEHGQPVTLEALPAEDYVFLYWLDTGLEISESPDLTFIATKDRDLEAVFSHVDDLVRIDASSFPPGYAFIEGAGDYPVNRRVNLKATPMDMDYSFVGWMENGRYIGLENPFLFNALEDRNIEARFTYEPGELEVIAHLSIPETGFIYGAGNYSRGQVAILQAELHENVSFIGWKNQSGQIVSRQNPYNFEVNRSMDMTAMVELKDGMLDGDFQLKIYPNPSDGRFTVNIMEEALMTVHNSQGIALESMKVTPENNQLNLGYLPSGVYFLRFQTQKEVLSRKIIIR